MNMLFMTQHYDTISRLGEQGVNTIFVPYSAGSVGDLQTQIQTALLGTDAILKSTDQKMYTAEKPTSMEPENNNEAKKLFDEDFDV